MSPELSIVIPTCNRPMLLERALDSIRRTVGCSLEIIVVDGSDAGASDSVLRQAGHDFGLRLKVIRETRRQGFVNAANRGFGAAGGRCLTWLNDDARVLDGAYDRAVAKLAQGPSDLGLLALFHRWQSPRNVAFETVIHGRSFKLCHVRGTLYANFAIGLRSTFQRLGFFDPQYFVSGADPDLSLKSWNAGLRVEPAWGCCIDHDEHDDDRRHTDAPASAADNARLFQKWDLPPKDLLQNDFDSSRPCTLRGLTRRLAA